MVVFDIFEIDVKLIGIGMNVDFEFGGRLGGIYCG